jgi:hypothetical protein
MKRAYNKSGKYEQYYQVVRTFDNKVVAHIKSFIISRIVAKEFEKRYSTQGKFIVTKTKNDKAKNK